MGPIYEGLIKQAPVLLAFQILYVQLLCNDKKIFLFFSQRLSVHSSFGGDNSSSCHTRPERETELQLRHGGRQAVLYQVVQERPRVLPVHPVR